MYEIRFHGRWGQGAEMAVKELQGMEYPFIPDRRGEIARPFHDGEFVILHPERLNWVLTEIGDNKGC